MRFCKGNLLMLRVLIAGLSLMPAGRMTAQTFTFGPEVQSTNTANITYNSGTGAFQYTDTNNFSADFAGLPLVGTVATLITPTNEWTASLTANLAARSMPGSASEEVYVEMGLYVIINNDDFDSVSITLDQENNTGTGGNFNFYGTTVSFEALTNDENLATTPLGSSSNEGGTSYQILSGGNNPVTTTEPVNAAAGVLTFSNNAATETLTGYYNGSPVGSISLGSWGPNPSLFVAVVGLSEYGVNVPTNTDTASNFFAGPILAMTPTFLSGPQVNGGNTNFTFLLTGPGGSNYVLQASTNLVNWSPVSTSAIPAGGSIQLSNVISGYNRRFYRAYLY